MAKKTQARVGRQPKPARRPTAPTNETVIGVVLNETDQDIRHGYVCAALPVVLREFFGDNEAWAGYDDLATTVHNIADALWREGYRRGYVIDVPEAK